MDSYPELNSDWGEMLTSDLKGMKGIILYKEYVEKELTNYVLTHVERTSTHNVEMPQHIIDMYLCKDGKTIHNSSEYEWSQDGDNSMNATFRNRDLRLLETVAPPYKVIPSADNTSWEYTSDPKDREFMDIMGITRYTGFGGGNGEAGKHKVFPLMNWSAAILKGMPHFFTNNGGQGFLVARSGNYVYRYYNVWDNSKENEGTSDVPLFKIDEVMLNYAEAKFEKGGTGAEGFNQTVADLTINKLRDRVGVAHMKVAEINAGFDPKRDQTVDPVLWEIRRERIVELMGEGFGFYDVRRWKKAPWFINKIQYGQWATKEQIGDSGQCGSALEREDRALRCANGHSYDIARQGYVHLLPVKQMHAKIPGDTKQMVDARRVFLSGGYYDAFRDKLAELTDKYLPENGVVLDAGCGEGFYTSALYEKAKAKNSSVSGVDISKFAVKAAAGKYKGIDFAVASLFHLPCAENSADVLTDVFAPIVPEEFFRVLKPGGVMILAVPGARHLYGMKEVLYKEPYENEEHDTAYDGFEYLGRACVQKFITVNGQENIEALFSMTPYYWKTDVEGGERLRALDVLGTEIKFDFLVYRKK